MITFETEARIERPIEEVFTYVSDPLNLPHWNSAVHAVRKTGENGVASTYSMQRELPTGTAVNELEVVALERPTEFAVRTVSGPTPFHYRYQFSAESGRTVVRLEAEFELRGAVALVAQLARRAVKRGVDHNLASLKELLESRPSRAS